MLHRSIPVEKPPPPPAHLQFCFWDQLKELDGMEVRRLTNLARLMASILAALALPATMLKVNSGDGWVA